MANGVDGFIACVRKVVSALYYLKQWPRGVRLPMGFGKLDFVPYAAPAKELNGVWKEWIGKWEGDWRFTDEDGPRLGFQDFAPMALRLAALGVVAGEYVFVVDGIDVAVRLWKVDGENKLELWQTEPKELKRVGS